MDSYRAEVPVAPVLVYVAAQRTLTTELTQQPHASPSQPQVGCEVKTSVPTAVRGGHDISTVCHISEPASLNN